MSHRVADVVQGRPELASDVEFSCDDAVEVVHHVVKNHQGHDVLVSAIEEEHPDCEHAQERDDVGQVPYDHICSPIKNFFAPGIRPLDREPGSQADWGGVSTGGAPSLTARKSSEKPRPSPAIWVILASRTRKSANIISAA